MDGPARASSKRKRDTQLPYTPLLLRAVTSSFTVMPLTESWARETLVKSLETGGVPAVFAHTADDSVWTVVSPSSRALPISGKYDVSGSSSMKSVAVPAAQRRPEYQGPRG